MMPAWLLLVATTLALSACLDDSPLTPTIADRCIALVVQGALLPGAVFEARVFWLSDIDGGFGLVQLSARDTRSSGSTALARELSPVQPSVAPAVFELPGTLTSSSVNFSFLVDDPQGHANVVELVFRNVVDDEIVVADTVYGSCRRSIPLGNGPKTVSCPRVHGADRTMVVVFPFDVQGNWGRGDRCAIWSSSFSCVAP